MRDEVASAESRPKASSKAGKITLKKATASAIRKSLGVTAANTKVGASALAKAKAVKRKKAPTSRPITAS
jgi:hypothetical protein